MRFAPYLGIPGAALLAFFIATYSSDVVYESPRAVHSASSSLAVLPNVSLPELELPSLLPTEQEVVATTTPPSPPKKTAVAATSTAPVAQPATPAPEPVVEAPPASVSSGSASLDLSASVLRAALVNIICYAAQGSKLKSTSGSGVIIDSKGIILTNAHIAQHFLFSPSEVSCTIRTGTPARDAYHAALIYIPSAWVADNAGVITQASPTGTGERDYALLAITTSATSAPLPTVFPYIPLATTPPTAGTPVIIATYGAQFLQSSQIQSSLSPTFVFGSVKGVFTFQSNTVDVIALGGSVAAQQGSSGGGVADASGTLIGTITTSTTEGDTSTRNVNAITASYIRSSYASDTGQALDLRISSPLMSSIAAFLPQIQPLKALITAQLN